MDTLEKVTKLICERLGKSPEKVTPESKIVEDLGADSLDIVEMLMELEDEFGITVPDEDSQKFATIGEVANYIAEHEAK